MSDTWTIEETGVYVTESHYGDIELAEGIVLGIAGPSSNNKVFHTRDCGFLPRKCKTMDRELLEAWGRSECGYCSETKPDRTPKPRCGRCGHTYDGMGEYCEACHTMRTLEAAKQ